MCHESVSIFYKCLNILYNIDMECNRQYAAVENHILAVQLSTSNILNVYFSN